MKRAVVTIACGEEHAKMAAITQPTMRAYADKLGADFIVWTNFEGHIVPAYKKLDLGGLLDQYDRLLYLDNDVLVRDDAPDIIEVVPEDCLGLFEEGQYVVDPWRPIGV